MQLGGDCLEMRAFVEDKKDGWKDTCERLAVIQHGTLLTRAGRASCIS